MIEAREQTMNATELTNGQQIQYYFMWAGGSDISQHLWAWFPGYKVVETISPFVPGCALIVRDNGHQNAPFNAPYSRVRNADIRILS